MTAENKIAGQVASPAALIMPTPAKLRRDFRPRKTPSREATPFNWGVVEYSLPAALIGDDGDDFDDENYGGSENNPDDDLAHIDAETALKHLASSIGRSHVPLDGYLELRVAWLHAHFRLNAEGRLAPRFRPPLDPRQVPETVEQATFACDRQVIDLHWLHCTGFRASVQQAEFASLLCDGEFDFEMAAEFARANVTVDRKVEMWLALNMCVQWQLSGLQTKAVRKRWASIRRGEPRGTPGLPQVIASLRGGIGVANSVTPEECAIRWAVEKMLPEASASERAHLFAVARGLAEDPKPHVFQRQQTAAMSRIARALRSTVEPVP